MDAEQAETFYRLAECRLRASRVYNVVTLQDGLGINVLVILDAIGAGEIPRSLGLGLETCVLGNDVVDWLRNRAHRQRKPW
jgi:hypothetical protein